MARLVRPWIISGAIGFGAVALVLSTPFPDSVEWRFGLLFGGFLVGAVSIAGANSAVSAHNRCPACDRMVRNDRGVLVDPGTCPRCGATLK